MKPRPAKRTRVKMLWDDEYLYIGAELEEDQIWAEVIERMRSSSATTTGFSLIRMATLTTTMNSR